MEHHFGKTIKVKRVMMLVNDLMACGFAGAHMKESQLPAKYRTLPDEHNNNFQDNNKLHNQK